MADITEHDEETREEKKKLEMRRTISAIKGRVREGKKIHRPPRP